MASSNTLRVLCKPDCFRAIALKAASDNIA
jgi:hypothetical protein